MDMFSSKSGGSSSQSSSQSTNQTTQRNTPDWLMSLLQGSAYGTSGGSKLQAPAVDYLTGLLKQSPEVSVQEYTDSTNQAYQNALDQAIGASRTRSSGLPVGRAGFAEGEAIARVADARAREVANMREMVRQFGKTQQLQGAGQLGQYANQENSYLLNLANLLSGSTTTGTGTGVGTGTSSQWNQPSIWDNLMKVGGAAGGAMRGF